MAPSTNENYFYKLKHKYDCLTNANSPTQRAFVPSEVNDCLNLFFDYPVEQCLKSYEESQGPSNLELYERDNKKWYGIKEDAQVQLSSQINSEYKDPTSESEKDVETYLCSKIQLKLETKSFKLPEPQISDQPLSFALDHYILDPFKKQFFEAGEE